MPSQTPWYWWLIVGASIAAPLGLLLWAAADDGADLDTPVLPTYPGNVREKRDPYDSVRQP